MTDVTAQDQDTFQQFESAGFLHIVESASGPVVLLLGRNFAYASVRHLLPSLQRFVAAKLEAAASTSYSLLYVHTGCSYWANSPGVAWLRRAYAALPPTCHERLARCYVLHADWALRASAAALCPWLAANLWGKVEYVARAEFLPQELQEAVELPRYVVEHDGDLAKQPLLDYGIAADAAETPLPHLAGLRAGGT